MKRIWGTLLGVMPLIIMAMPASADISHSAYTRTFHEAEQATVKLAKAVSTAEVTERVIVKTREKQLSKAKARDKGERSRKKTEPERRSH